LLFLGAGVASGAGRAVGESGAEASAVDGLPSVRSSVDVNKFSKYIFKEGAGHGKDKVFRSLGYDAQSSEKLAQEWADSGGGSIRFE
jgi:hypothetical protein